MSDTPRQASATVSSGSFPASPFNGQQVYRTDIGLYFTYNSTLARWLSSNLIWAEITKTFGTSPIDVDGAVYEMVKPFAGVYDIYVEDFTVVYTMTGTSAANGLTSQLAAYGADIDYIGVPITSLNDVAHVATKHVQHANEITTAVRSRLLVITDQITGVELTGNALCSISYRIVGPA